MRRCFQFCLTVALALGARPVIAQSVPEIPFDSVQNFLKMPAGDYIGEAAGVATNSKGHVFVFTRSGETRLLEFDQNGTFVKDLQPHSYGFAFAHAVRVDAHDNIWAVDEGTNMVMKLSPEGKLLMLIGRRPESAEPGGFHPPEPGVAPIAQPYTFNRQTDIAWDAADNIFVSDGYGNSRVVKFDKNGVFLKSIGTRGASPGQFNTPHTIATDKDGNVFVGDRGNNRIQVFDNDLRLRAVWTGMGAPWAICITPGPNQTLYSSDAAGPVYKIDMNGKILGKFGTAGKELKQFGWIHEIDCRNPNELIVGELLNWRVQKLTLRPQGPPSSGK
jgi:outer membrane protein assembly factor BamB